MCVVHGICLVFDQRSFTEADPSLPPSVWNTQSPHVHDFLTERLSFALNWTLSFFRFRRSLNGFPALMSSSELCKKGIINWAFYCKSNLQFLKYVNISSLLFSALRIAHQWTSQVSSRSSSTVFINIFIRLLYPSPRAFHSKLKCHLFTNSYPDSFDHPPSQSKWHPSIKAAMSLWPSGNTTYSLLWTTFWTTSLICRNARE